MNQLVQIFKALSDETRIRMLWLLLNADELCVCDFVEFLGITQSKASRHLRYMLNSGLLTDRREGVWMKYRIKKSDDPEFNGIMKALSDALRHSRGASSLLEQFNEWVQFTKHTCK